jgi:hypothetical protein
MRVMMAAGFVGVVVSKVNFKLHRLDLAAFDPMGVQVVAVQGELGQLPLNLCQVHAQIEHGAQEHVAADAAEDIQVKRFQSLSFPAVATSSLIWLAA